MMRLETVAADDANLVAFMRRIGWFPSRTVDLDADLEAWAERRYIVSDPVRKFMTETSGLHFDYPRHQAVGGLHSCVVSGTKSTRGIARKLVAEHEEKLGLNLCPIGISASGNLFLLMDSDGITYGCHDKFMAKVANDGYRALLAIWNRDDLIPLV
jgi:hypothetical protein